MKTWQRLVALLLVLGFCLPGYGEILVYKHTLTSTEVEQHNGVWVVKKTVHKGYFIFNFNYENHTITQAEGIDYGTSAGNKVYSRHPMNPELVRAQIGRHFQWVLVLNDLKFVGGHVAGSYFIVTGSTGNRDVGAPATDVITTGTKREVANKLTGYDLSDTTELGDREFGLTSVSLTLYPAWTRWSNGSGAGQGGQDFEATTQMIVKYLETRGYEEES